MSDPLSDSERNDDHQEASPGMPRWVKVSVVVVLIVAAVLVVVMALSGGEHGPGLHTSADARAFPSFAVVSP